MAWLTTIATDRQTDTGPIRIDIRAVKLLEHCNNDTWPDKAALPCDQPRFNQQAASNRNWASHQHQSVDVCQQGELLDGVITTGGFSDAPPRSVASAQRPTLISRYFDSGSDEVQRPPKITSQILALGCRHAVDFASLGLQCIHTTEPCPPPHTVLSTATARPLLHSTPEKRRWAGEQWGACADAVELRRREWAALLGQTMPWLANPPPRPVRRPAAERRHRLHFDGQW